MSKEKKKDSSLCTVDGCFSERCSKLYCQKHYRRNKLYGDPLVLKNERNDGKCSVPGCYSKSAKKGLCDKHYSRLQKHGSTDACKFERDNPDKMSIMERIKKNKKVNRSTGCWEWQKFRNKHGYGKITYEGKKWIVHRLAFSVFVDKIPEGGLVLHKCDNPCCCNPSHLYLGNHSDNNNDVIRRDRRNKEEKPNIIDKYTAIQIFSLLGEKSNKDISELFNVSIQSVSRLRRKITHQEIYKELPLEIRKTIRFRKNIKPDSRGEKNPSAILSSAEVIKIRKLYGKGWTITELATKFDVGRTTVKRVVEFETWRNLSVDPESDELDLHNSHVDGLIARRKKTAKSYLERGAKLDRDNLKVRREAGSGILTEAEVVRIKKLLKKGEMTNAEIGRKFGVTSWAISRIKCGKNWKHIEI